MAERKTLLIPSLLDDWFPLLRYAFASERWEPVLLTEDDPHLAELGLKHFQVVEGVAAIDHVKTPVREGQALAVALNQFHPVPQAGPGLGQHLFRQV